MRRGASNINLNKPSTLAHTVLVGFLTGVGFQVGIAMPGDMLVVAVHSRKTLVQGLEVLQGRP